MDHLCLAPNLLVDLLEVQIRILIDEVKSPPASILVEGGHIQAMPCMCLWRRSHGCTIERHPDRAVRRVVAEPGDTAGSRSGFKHIGIGRAEHGDGPLPLPCNAFDGTPIWVAVGPSSHTFGQIICCALIVISQGLHHHFTGHGVLRCFHRRWVWIFGPGQISQVRVQFGSLSWAQEAEDAPHAPAAVVGQEVAHTLDLFRRGVFAAGLVTVGAKKIEVAGELGVRWMPPAHFLCQFSDTWTEQVVFWILQIQASNGEGIPHCCHMVAGQPLSSPDGTGIALSSQDIEDPHVTRLRIHYDQCF
mmetsp:Transcript_78275/g.172740  ORF Transcript_78275/g.172740 Transcript_78275/m.172740 type:complete len:303 (-) Transcript_78275:627-1535(-)